MLPTLPSASWPPAGVINGHNARNGDARHLGEASSDLSGAPSSVLEEVRQMLLKTNARLDAIDAKLAMQSYHQERVATLPAHPPPLPPSLPPLTQDDSPPSATANINTQQNCSSSPERGSANSSAEDSAALPRVAHCVAGLVRNFAHPSLLLPRLLKANLIDALGGEASL